MEIMVGVSIIVMYLLIRNCTEKIANDCRLAPQFNNLHYSLNKFPLISYSREGCVCVCVGGGGVLSYKRLMGMFCWMGSHFYGWIDCKGFAFYNRVTRMGSHICGFFG